jgi:hypothetical protein
VELFAGEAEPMMAAGPWPAHSAAEVAFFPGERHGAQRRARRLFGRALRTWEYAGLTGAPDNARVEVGTCAGDLYVEMREPRRSCYFAVHMVRDGDEGPVVVDDGFHILLAGMQRHGLGLWIFHRQLWQARALGVKFIQTTAGRRASENGYYTWPRYGFDGPLPDAVRRRLPPPHRHARRVLDLMASAPGRAWWRRHGVTLQVAFDLADGSRSRRVFERYLREKLGLSGGT